MPDSTEILAAVERGYLRSVDLASMWDVTKARVSQITQRDDFSPPAVVIGSRRLWRREDVERWQDEKPRVWAPVE